jgi:hypothetical protein
MFSSSVPVPPSSEVEIPKRGKRNSFTPEEDARLVELVTDHPSDSWAAIAAQFPGRSARQCRERWNDYLNPNIRMEPWTEQEDELLLVQIERFGHQWKMIATGFAQRSASDIKNRWYSHLRFSVVLTPMGRFEFLRDHKGRRITQKLKRNKKAVFPGRMAFAAVEKKRMEQKLENHMWLPQLCSKDCARLNIEDLLQGK